MRFALMIEAQQGLSYEDQLSIARRAEAAGFEAMFRSDPLRLVPRRSEPADDGRLGGLPASSARRRPSGWGCSSAR